MREDVPRANLEPFHMCQSDRNV